MGVAEKLEAKTTTTVRKKYVYGSVRHNVGWVDAVAGDRASGPSSHCKHLLLCVLHASPGDGDLYNYLQGLQQTGRDIRVHGLDICRL